MQATHPHLLFLTHILPLTLSEGKAVQPALKPFRDAPTSTTERKVSVQLSLDHPTFPFPPLYPKLSQARTGEAVTVSVPRGLPWPCLPGGAVGVQSSSRPARHWPLGLAGVGVGARFTEDPGALAC